MVQDEYQQNEKARISALRELRILDTVPEERFDRITRLASHIFDVPIALVSLVDTERLFLKSHQGIDANQIPREKSFCDVAIQNDFFLLVPDATKDERFRDSPFVVDEPNIRFYAGYPLSVGDNKRVGTLCIIDKKSRDISEINLPILRDLAKMVEEQLEAMHLATIDELTEISNRRGFLTLANYALDHCKRNKEPACLLYMDLNNFKAINDKLGHGTGDQALKDFAHNLTQCFRGSDIIARLGGDEFCVMITGESANNPEQPIDRLNRILEERQNSHHRPYILSCSIGIVPIDTSQQNSIEDLLQEADKRMFEEKTRLKQRHN